MPRRTLLRCVRLIDLLQVRPFWVVNVFGNSAILYFFNGFINHKERYKKPLGRKPEATAVETNFYSPIDGRPKRTLYAKRLVRKISLTGTDASNNIIAALLTLKIFFVSIVSATT